MITLEDKKEILNKFIFTRLLFNTKKNKKIIKSFVEKLTEEELELHYKKIQKEFRLKIILLIVALITMFPLFLKNLHGSLFILLTITFCMSAGFLGILIINKPLIYTDKLRNKYIKWAQKKVMGE
jgi:hypothetical protein